MSGLIESEGIQLVDEDVGDVQRRLYPKTVSSRKHTTVSKTNVK